jgi:hypothetical protein
MKRFVNLLIFYLFFFCFTVFSKEVKQDEAFKVASSFVNQHCAGFTKSLPSLSLAYICSDVQTKTVSGSNVYYYVYNITSLNGFVIISGDDRAFPVLGYSDKGSFDSNSIPDNFRYWLNEYKMQIAWVTESGKIQSQTVGEQWAALQSGKALTSENSSVLLQTALWNQMKPYNEKCPNNSSGLKRCPTGCVATAMGILMKYHRWPLKGTGNYSYVSKTLNKALFADFELDYIWDDMLDEYKMDGATNLWNDNQAWMISTLMYHCGVASEMDYSSSSSGAYTYNAVKGMIEYFGYDKCMRLLPREYYKDDEWNQMIRNELDNSRPVMYGGSNEGGDGHQFIFDGYNSNGYYHVNWGWGGLSNGYYLLSSLDPDSQGTGGNGGAGFSNGQELVIGIKKAEQNSDYVTNLYLTSYNDVNGLFMNESNVEANKDFNVSFVAYNYCLKAFSGMIGIGLVNESNELKEIVGGGRMNNSLSFLELVSAVLPCKITTNLLATDKLQPFYSDDGVIWKRIRGSNTTINELSVNNPTAINYKTCDTQIKVLLSEDESTLSVSIPFEFEAKQVSIFNTEGRMINQINLSDNEMLYIPVNKLPKGLYVGLIQIKNGMESFKFIKK